MIRVAHGERGFTLLEVLVALAIVATALGALVRAAGGTASNLAYLRDKTVASWVAENRIAELYLAELWPPIGTNSGPAEMAGQEWFWSTDVSATSDPDLRRVEVSVAHDVERDEPLVTLVGFLGRVE